MLAVAFLLGAGQGLLGWYMVKSGLVDVPHVSQYRLTAHLAAAVVIYVYLLWIAIGVLCEGRPVSPRAARTGIGLGVLVFLTLLSGGFVAGIKAGLAYDTFPLMGGQWIPDGMYDRPPWYRNWFENVTTVQFNHRLLATLTVLAILGTWLGLRGASLPYRGLWLHLAAATVLVQAALGISTLLLGVPVVLASLHQTGALALLTTLVALARAR
jgi:cytochrome c oxidase assembly protein subunit 15